MGRENMASCEDVTDIDNNNETANEKDLNAEVVNTTDDKRLNVDQQSGESTIKNSQTEDANHRLSFHIYENLDKRFNELEGSVKSDIGEDVEEYGVEDSFEYDPNTGEIVLAKKDENSFMTKNSYEASCVLTNDNEDVTNNEVKNENPYDENKMKEASMTQTMEEITSDKSELHPMQISRDKISIATLIVASCLVFAILKSKATQLFG